MTSNHGAAHRRAALPISFVLALAATAAVVLAQAPSPRPPGSGPRIPQELRDRVQRGERVRVVRQGATRQRTHGVRIEVGADSVLLHRLHRGSGGLSGVDVGVRATDREKENIPRTSTL